MLCFGDSWVQYMHPTWPQLMAAPLNMQVLNFGMAGSHCRDLAGQAAMCLANPQTPKAPGGLLGPKTLVVVHTCGNDLIQKTMEGAMALGGPALLLGGGGAPQMRGPPPELLRANPGAHEAATLKTFLETMHRAGARNFLVSGVPIFQHMPIFNMVWPLVTTLTNAGMLEDLGMSPGDPPQMAMEVQASALYERWNDLCTDFSKEHPGTRCVMFDEVEALESLRLSLGAPRFDAEMWDFSMFHPTAIGHQHLVGEAVKRVIDQFPELGPGGARQTPSSPARPVATPQTPPPVASTDAVNVDVRPAEAPSSSADGKAETNNNSISLSVRNVKGDVNFAVACEPQWTVAKLKEAILASAPSGFVQEDMVCHIALKGKFLTDGSALLSSLGVADGAQVIVALKPAKPAS